MLSSAFSSSIQAISAYSQSFAAISDNVVNVNTTGYKDTQIQFRDLVGGKKPGSIFENMSGSRPVIRNYTQHEGGVIYSARDLDAALNGQGYFLTQTTLDGTGDYHLSAAGRFELAIPATATNDETYIVDHAGNYLLGWPYNPEADSFTTGTALTSVQPIQVDSNAARFAPVATTAASFRGMLPANAAIGDSHTFSTGIIDGSGDADGFNDEQQINFTWTKTAAGIWDMAVSATGGTVTAPATDSVLTFDPKGLAPDINGAGSNLSVGVTWDDSGATNLVVFDFAELAQRGEQFVVNSYQSNGTKGGVIENIYFDKNGMVMANFTNGKARQIAKIPAADVRAPEFLQRVGQTHFEANAKSGDITLYEIDLTERVEFVAQGYEASSADLGQEMTNMIMMQRAYSSAATALKTIDEMAKTATNLK